ncbi:MAG: transposase family protein [Deltaproteobacteria bacterium]|nr:transposase family protein [Deltaproteobacteria bacterium]
MSTLEADGRLYAGQLTAQTLRRLYRREGLHRLRRRDKRVVGERHRWEAGHVGDLWHADVCHASELVEGRTNVRIHALLDDKARYIVAIRVLDHEREVGMLDLLLEAIRQHGAPRRLFLDNGSTYSGTALETACGRLGITLLHARPYDPQARGKMERYWRTLREGCLDHMSQQSTLHDVQGVWLAS